MASGGTAAGIPIILENGVPKSPIWKERLYVHTAVKFTVYVTATNIS